MKFKLSVLFCAFILALTANFAISQTREYDNGINYQAVIRDGDGNILANQEFDIRFSFKTAGEGVELYSEEHIVNSDDFGIVNLLLLRGDALNGTQFYQVDWKNERMALTTFINDVEMGTILFTDVPYSKYAEYAGQLSNPVFGESFWDVYVDYEDITTGSVLTYDGEYWTDEPSLIVRSTGIGIGVELPEEKLDVDGNVKLSGKVNRPSTDTANLVPVAYGMINADGTLSASNSTANVSVSKEGTGIYHVTVADETYTYFGYVPVLTTVTEGTVASSGSVSGKMVVKVTNLDGSATDGRVYFVIYKM